jgi:hypothetical protein
VIEGEGEGGDTELTLLALQTEITRTGQVIVVMGDVVRVASIDPIGVVEIEYRGPNQAKKGLELALLDLEFTKHDKWMTVSIKRIDLSKEPPIELTII